MTAPFELDSHLVATVGDGRRVEGWEFGLWRVGWSLGLDIEGTMVPKPASID